MTSEEINSFWQENGYYVARGVFTPEEIALLEEDFDRMVAQIAGSGEDANIREAWGGSEMNRLGGAASVVIHSNNPQCFSARWQKAITHDGFLDQVETLIGPDIILHHAKLFQKPSENGSPFPMHQDWPYFPTFQDTMMAGIIHGSMPNRSSETRKTVLVQMHTGSDAIDPAGPGHPNMRLALRGWNHTITRATAAAS